MTLESANLRLDIILKIQAVVQEVLVEPDIIITEQTVAQDVAGWDSVAHVQIIVNIEAILQILFEAEQIVDFEDVAGLVDAIMEKVAEKVGRQGAGEFT